MENNQHAGHEVGQPAENVTAMVKKQWKVKPQPLKISRKQHQDLKTASCLVKFNALRSPECLDEPLYLAGKYLEDIVCSPSRRFSNTLCFEALSGKLMHFKGLCSLDSFLHLLLNLKEKGLDAFICILLQRTWPELKTMLTLYQPPRPLSLFSEMLRATLVERSFQMLPQAEKRKILNSKLKPRGDGDILGYGTLRDQRDWLEIFSIVSVSRTEECLECHARCAFSHPALMYQTFISSIKQGRFETCPTKKGCSLTHGCDGTILEQLQVSPFGFLVEIEKEDLVAVSEAHLNKYIPKSCRLQGVSYTLTSLALATYAASHEQDNFFCHDLLISLDKLSGKATTINDTGLSKDFLAGGFAGILQIAVYIAAPAITEEPLLNEAALMPQLQPVEKKGKGHVRRRKRHEDPLPHDPAEPTTGAHLENKVLTRAAARIKA